MEMVVARVAARAVARVAATAVAATAVEATAVVATATGRVAKEVCTNIPLPFVFMKPIDAHYKLYLSEATRVSATSMPLIDPRCVT